MSRLKIPARDDAPAASVFTLDRVHEKLGFVPNVDRLLSISPIALAGFVGLKNSLKHAFDQKTLASIALAVAEASKSDYCVAAHTYTAMNFAGLSEDEVALNRHGKSNDPQRAAAAWFARNLILKRGHLTDEDIKHVRDAGFDDPQIVELIALASQNLLTNFLTTASEAPIDFPSATSPD